jgi:Undecaprenyl-phosphate galactose phosphotransferase WbaP
MPGCRAAPSLLADARKLANRSIFKAIRTALPLAIVDFATLWFVLMVSAAIVERLNGLPTTFITRNTALLASLILVPSVWLAGLYPALGMNPVVEFRQLMAAVALALIFFTGAIVVHFQNEWEFAVLASCVAFLAALPLAPATRYFARLILSRFGWWGENVLIFADRTTGTELFQRMKSFPEAGLRPRALLVHPAEYWDSAPTDSIDIPCHDVRDAISVAMKSDSTWVVICKNENNDCEESWTEAVEAELANIPHRVLLSAGHFDMGLWDCSQTVGTACGIRLKSNHPSSFASFVKRATDVVLSGLALVAGSPLFAIIAVLTKWSSAGPVFYSQPRIGARGRTFRAWKFRTMSSDADQVLEKHLASNPEFRREWEETRKLKDDPRVTRFGRFLRQTSLDELPQLWNILKGDMSLIGPRPIVDSSTFDSSYILDYPKQFSVYCSVRPGLSGLWQVTCRNNGVYEMRIYWDMYYVRNWSLWLDLYILLRTVRTVLLREGAY